MEEVLNHEKADAQARLTAARTDEEGNLARCYMAARAEGLRMKAQLAAAFWLLPDNTTIGQLHSEVRMMLEARRDFVAVRRDAQILAWLIRQHFAEDGDGIYIGGEELFKAEQPHQLKGMLADLMSKG